jgi:geranylgeranyl pyrophosphate synthase
VAGVAAVNEDILNESSFIGLVRGDLDQVEALLHRRLPDQHPAIGTALDHLVSGGGKRLRPVLVLLSAHLCGAALERAVYAAAAVEMLHTATLIHDDLIDQASMRRGLETLNARWSPGATVLTGDYVFAYAAYLAVQADHVRLMHRFSETLMEICNGEIRQMFDFNGPQSHRVSRREYERRIYAKTASLIAMSAEAGAILSDADENVIQALHTYGEHLGLAFQIVDDVLDFVADEATLGKPVGSDLRHGLVTLPALLFLESEPDQPVVRRALTEATPPEVVEKAVQLVARSASIEASLDVARQRAARARAALDALPDSPYRVALMDLADFIVRRRF